VLHTIRRENFVNVVKSVSCLQGYYISCIIKYITFVDYQCFFTMIENNI